MMKFSHTGWVLLLVTGCYPQATLIEGSASGGKSGNTTVQSGSTAGMGTGKATGGAPASTPSQGSTAEGGTSTSAVGGASSGTSATGGASITQGSGGSAHTPAGECAQGLPADAKTYGYTAPRDPRVAELLNSMSIEDKVKQLYGLPNPQNRSVAAYGDLLRSQDVDLGNGKTLRGFRYRNGARGLTLADGQVDRPSEGKDYSTAFPAPSIRAASWDIELEMSVGKAIGDETLAAKNNVLFAPSLDIMRHPYWGRTQDTYGEDPYQVGLMGSAFTAGVQQHVIACASHYVGSIIENGRAIINVEADEQTLREIYTRPFGKVVRSGGIGCVMASYNSINGFKSTQNRHLLTDVLRTPVESGGMGFRGFTLTDLWAMPGDQMVPDAAQAQAVAQEAIQAGLDIELPWALNYSQLPALVSSGAVSTAELDTAVGRVVEQKFRFDTAFTEGPWGLGTPKTQVSGDSIVGNEEHLGLAEQVELKSAVLLRNGSGNQSVLPITTPQRIAVVGLEVPVSVSDQTDLPVTGSSLNFATDVNLGDRGSYRVNADPAASIGPYAGIKADGEAHGMTSVSTGTTVQDAAEADFVVVVVGLTAADEGEEYSVRDGNDRENLSLGAEQEQFVNEVLSLGKPTAIVVESGSVVNLPWLTHSNQNQATIWAGYGGQRIGAAIAKLMFGEVNFSGRLPFSWPKEAALPAFRDGDGMTTRVDYFVGYREYDRRAAEGMNEQLEFPFGWGLSYTSFTLGTPVAACNSAKKSELVVVKVPVTNAGSVDGQTVVMMFVSGPPKSPSIKGYRPIRELKAFTKVNVAAGQTAQATLVLNVQDLAHWEGDTQGAWVIDDGNYTLSFSADPNGTPSSTTITVQN